jgi:hypothetical protein
VTSALTGDGVEVLFEDMVAVSLNRPGCVITGLPLVTSPDEKPCC